MRNKNQFEPASVLDEDIWDKAKKASGKSYSADSDPKAYYGTAMDIYKKMGGRLKGKSQKQSDITGDMPKPSVGIKTYWSWITPDKKSKQADDSDSATPDSAAIVPQEVTDALVKNPKMSGATLINWLKANGFEIKKKV